MPFYRVLRIRSCSEGNSKLKRESSEKDRVGTTFSIGFRPIKKGQGLKERDPS